MYKIIDTRGSGKTSRLILLAVENGGTIVARHPESIFYKKQRYGINGLLTCISYQDFIEGNYDKDSPLFIDEISDLVAYMAPGLNGFTLSNDEV